MAFCRQCGTQFEDGTRFCPSCGTSVSARTEETRRTAPSYTPPVVPGAQRSGDIRDAQDNKTMAILAYIGFLVFIPMFAAKESKFARFHANQGLVLFIIEAAYGILYAILSAIIFAISWRLLFLVTIIGILSLVFVVLAVIGIINASKGEKKELPVIGKIRILK